jgi:hypothetical protein
MRAPVAAKGRPRATLPPLRVPETRRERTIKTMQHVLTLVEQHGLLVDVIEEVRQNQVRNRQGQYQRCAQPVEKSNNL